jgi:predicted metal-dependent peptidase
MLDEPYLSSAVARYPLVDATDTDWCPTLATDGYTIFANSEFCETLDHEEMIFVFAHEVIHCMFGHTDRRGDRDPLLWNYAIDYATNLMLQDFGMKMPKVGLLDHKYRNMTTEDIYESLVKNSPPQNIQYAESGNIVLSNKNPFDVHLNPDDPRALALAEEELPSPQERLRLRKTLSKQLAQKLRSTECGYNHSEIEMAEGGKVPWQDLIAQFFTGIRRDNYRMLPPNKKHIWRGIYLPSLGVPGPDHIVVAIDTSGSMSDQILSEALGEIDHLRSLSQCTLTLIQCDAKVEKVERFDEWDEAEFNRKRMHGRGGTSFVPVFDWIKKEQENTGMSLDCLFYITDGYGDAPEHAPPYPVAWIVTEHHNDNFGFGNIIEM